MTEGAEIAPERLADLIEGGDAQVIDIRDDDEHEAGHIAGSRHIPISQLSAEAGSIDRERPVVLYCRGGNRSPMAAEALRASGFDASNLAGGLLAWAEQGLPLEPEDGQVAERSGLPPA
jgi:rhodanese-related sulfurtransferase